MKRLIVFVVASLITFSTSAVNWISLGEEVLGESYIDLDSIKVVDRHNSLVTAYDKLAVRDRAAEITFKRAYKCKDKSTNILSYQTYDSEEIRSGVMNQDRFLALTGTNTPIYRKWAIACDVSDYDRR